MKRRQYLEAIGGTTIGLSALGGVSTAKDTKMNVITISGTGEPAQYELSVTEALEKSTANGANTNGNDTIDGTTATGEVGISADSYAYRGTVERLEIDGHTHVAFGTDSDTGGDTGSGGGGSGEDSGPTFGADFAQQVGEDPTQEYEDWLGRTVLVADEYQKKEERYYDIPSWRIDPWSDWVAENDDRRMAWDTKIRQWQTLETAANGDANDAMQAFGRQLVNNGMSDAYIRIVAEFDLGHTINPTTNEECRQFVEFWQHTVDTLRSVDGQEFTVVWNPNCGIRYKGDRARKTWPGDGYVDQVGIDIYDRNWDQYDGSEQPTETDHQEAWSRSRAHLDWFRNWADDHGKELCVPEWGVWEHTSTSHGGGDNPYFIQKMYEWMHENDVAWHVYFEELHKHELYGPDTQFPEASAQFEQLFG